MKTIFQKIIDGEINAHKIYEDDRVLAFLDIFPANTGHTLVIPKQAVEFVWDLPAEDYNYLMTITQKLARHLRSQLPYQYVGSQIVGIDVPHAHIHLIPFNTVAEFTNADKQPADPTELANLAQKLFITEL